MLIKDNVQINYDEDSSSSSISGGAVGSIVLPTEEPDDESVQLWEVLWVLIIIEYPHLFGLSLSLSMLLCRVRGFQYFSRLLKEPLTED